MKWYSFAGSNPKSLRFQRMTSNDCSPLNSAFCPGEPQTFYLFLLTNLRRTLMQHRSVKNFSCPCLRVLFKLKVLNRNSKSNTSLLSSGSGSHPIITVGERPPQNLLRAIWASSTQSGWPSLNSDRPWQTGSGEQKPEFLKTRLILTGNKQFYKWAVLCARDCHFLTFTQYQSHASVIRP